MKAHEALHADVGKEKALGFISNLYLSIFFFQKLERLEAKSLYECTDCPYKTNHNSNFKAHLLHHSDEGKEGEEKCKFCNYYASTRTLIKKHEDSHMKLEETFEHLETANKYACKLCPYKSVRITFYSISLR